MVYIKFQPSDKWWHVLLPDDPNGKPYVLTFCDGVIEDINKYDHIISNKRVKELGDTVCPECIEEIGNTIDRNHVDWWLDIWDKLSNEEKMEYAMI